MFVIPSAVIAFEFETPTINNQYNKQNNEGDGRRGSQILRNGEIVKRAGDCLEKRAENDYFITDIDALQHAARRPDRKSDPPSSMMGRRLKNGCTVILSSILVESVMVHPSLQ